MKKCSVQQGFLLSEVLISCAIFAMGVATLSVFFGEVRSVIDLSFLRIRAYAIADQELQKISSELEGDFGDDISKFFIQEQFSVHSYTEWIDNFTKKAKVVIEYPYHQRRVSVFLEMVLADISESEGQSTCRPDQDKTHWEHPLVTAFDMGTFGGVVVPTDIDMRGHFAYVSSNDSRASSSDFFIVDMSDRDDIKVLSSLDTGPGVEAVHVAGNFAYLANTSVNAQLQIVDITDKSHPFVVHSYKLPGLYTGTLPTGLSLSYYKKYVLLGTIKNSGAEFYSIDVSGMPRLVDQFEIGSGVNDIQSYRGKVYVASPHQEEVKSFLVSNSGMLSYVSGYNDPGSTGNGKSLSVFLEEVVVGKTQTFKREELLVLNRNPYLSLKYSLPFGVSVQGVISYGTLIFVLLHRASDALMIISKEESLGEMQGNILDVSGSALSFDCDRTTFGVVSDSSPIIYFIDPQ
jgi:hypothetical protein